MRSTMKRFAFTMLGAAMAAAAAHASTVVVVNFETNPVLPAGPSLFGAPEQNIVVPGVATFSGGAVLGDASNFPAIVYATAPNVYGTDDDFNYASALTITVDPAFTANEVSFPIFNGETSSESYIATAYDGATQVAQQTFTNVAANTDDGYALADLLAPQITSVTIAPEGAPASWDFLIDTVAFNESVTQAVSPEPGTTMLFAGGGLVLTLVGIVRRRQRSQQ